MNGHLLFVACLSLAAIVSVLRGEEPAPAPAEPAAAEAREESAPAPAVQPAEEQPSPDEVIERIERLRRRQRVAPIEPTPPAPSRSAEEPRSPQVRPAGTASPAARRGQGASYRDGEPLLGRRGRLVAAPEGQGAPSPWMLTFDSDSSGLHDAPLYLLPCRALEEMESAAADGQVSEFIVTGEIFVYRGRACLLPRMTRPAFDRGNLTR